MLRCPETGRNSWIIWYVLCTRHTFSSACKSHMHRFLNGGYRVMWNDVKWCEMMWNDVNVKTTSSNREYHTLRIPSPPGDFRRVLVDDRQWSQHQRFVPVSSLPRWRPWLASISSLVPCQPTRDLRWKKLEIGSGIDKVRMSRERPKST